MSPAESPPIDYKALVQDDRIHASLYTDPRIFADEMDRIFHTGGVFVGHDSEIPGAGDFVTRSLGREPVIMVRGQDGAVAVLVNRCMHRGTLLCPADRGSVRTFACPYHGWTYDLAGTLLGVPYPGGYGSFDKSAHGLARAPRVASYRGFVFASLSATGPTLVEHLGAATRLIDRSCDLAPDGEVALTAGWVKHRCAANWKMLPENDSDGYHLGFVHSALFRSIRTQYQRVVGEERSIKAVIRAWGQGHIEIDWSPGYQASFEWLGNASGDAVADYVAALERRDGPETTRRRLLEGPPTRSSSPTCSWARPTSPSWSRCAWTSACTGTRRCSSRGRRSSTAGCCAWPRRAWARPRSSCPKISSSPAATRPVCTHGPRSGCCWAAG